MIQLSLFDPVMRCRLAGVSDMMAAEGEYHFKCYVLFCRKHEHKGSQSEEKNPDSICFENTMTPPERDGKRTYFVPENCLGPL